MSRSVFGWDYPPGAANDPTAPYNQVDPPCAVCGKHPDDCICPECPTCGEQGNPACYADPPDTGHGMVKTQEQIDSLAAAEKRWAEAEEGPEYEPEVEDFPVMPGDGEERDFEP